MEADRPGGVRRPPAAARSRRTRPAMNFPWKDWEDEKWLTVLGYQSGHGDDANTREVDSPGPPARVRQAARSSRGRSSTWSRPTRATTATSRRQPHTDLQRPPGGVLEPAGRADRRRHLRRARRLELAHEAGRGADRPQGDRPGEDVEGGASTCPGRRRWATSRKLFESLPWTEPARPAQECVGQDSRARTTRRSS